jgi:23S rRNA (pseudouridine1915-N3)-methyltransferase
MRILLVAVGRIRNGPERELYRHYAARLAWPVTLKEIDLPRQQTPSRQKVLEGEKLLASVSKDAAPKGTMPKGTMIVALDERGEELDSQHLAQRIGLWRDRGMGELACLIGGADGLDEAVRRRADLVLSLGRVTWPHFLVRGLLAEQLYRAQQILAGHPYHRA